MNDFIDVFPNALAADICEEAIALADKTIADGRATTVNDPNGRIDHSIFIEMFPKFKKVRHSILDTLYKHYEQLADKYEMSGRDYLVPTYKIQRSDPGGGFFSWHTEQGSSESTRGRFMVWMIYLNTVEKGGTTDFKFFNKSFKPTQGTLIMWPASYTHSHRSSPDLEEYKYIATGWFDYSYPNR